MKKIIIVFIIFLTSAIAFCQSVSPHLVSTSGDTYKNTSYQLDWSIGELQTETYAATGQILTQGFQQGNYTITAVEQSNEFQFEIIAYPNPTTDFINLKIKNSKTETFQYIIGDISGKVLQTGKFSDNIQQFNFSEFPVGTYFISIQLNNQVVKSVKIVKN